MLSVTNHKTVYSLYGGLGNQLFQYFYGRAMAAELNALLLIDPSQVASGGRDFGLQELGLEPPILDSKTLTGAQQFVLKRFPGIQARSGFLGAVVNRLADFCGIGRSFVQVDLRYQDYLDQVSNGWNFFHGSWQSEQFFSGIKGSVFEEFEPVIETGKRLWGDTDLSNSVAVHVRRGDYVSNPETTKVHGVCSLEFYQKAMDRVAAEHPSVRFFVFSDDHDFIRSDFTVSHDFELVTTGKSAYDDLAMMCSCNHFVIANSSFSWWAAWVGEFSHKNSMVVAPDPWFQDPFFQKNDIVPERWLKVPI